MRLGKKWKKNFKNKINLKSKKVADKSAQWNKLRQLFFHRMDDHLASRKDRWRHLRVVSGPPDEYIHVRRRPSNCPIKSAKVFTGHWRIWQRSTRTPIFACFFFLCRDEVMAAPSLMNSVPYFTPITTASDVYQVDAKFLFYFNLSFCQRRKFGSRLIC